MTRSFAERPVPDELLEHLVSLAARSPSAGKAQGWHLVVLSGANTAKFWDVTLPGERRSSFRWPGLLKAPLIALPLADPAAYVERYSEPDKAATGLDAGIDVWPTPYWTVDASMAVMTMLLAVEDVGLGSLFFGVFANEAALRDVLGIPHHLELLGAIVIGWPSSDADLAGSGRSAARRRRTPQEIIHVNGW